jgi:hypothetical protein
MSNEVTAPQPYGQLLSHLISQVTASEGVYLLRYYQMGRLFSEFCEGLDVGRYGRGASVQLLADDLQRNGVLTQLRDPQRALYFARALYVLHPNLEQLMDMGKLGYTVSHAKLVAACKPELREAALTQAMVDGRYVTVPTLSAVVARLHEQAQVAAPEREADAGDEGFTPVADVPIVDAGPRHTPLADVDAEIPIPADTPGNPELPTPTPEARPDGATTNTIQERTRPPGRTLDGIEKLLDKLTSAIPDVFIVLRESAQIGTDSEAQQRRYMDRLREISGSSKTVRDTLIALIEEIDGEIDAGTARVAQ